MSDLFKSSSLQIIIGIALILVLSGCEKKTPDNTSIESQVINQNEVSFDTVASIKAARSLHDLAIKCIPQEDFEKGLSYLEQELSILTQIQDSSEIGKCYYTMGYFNRLMRKFTTAIECYEKSILYKFQHSIDSYSELSGIYKDLGDYNKSLDYCQTQLKLAINHKNPNEMLDAYLNLSNLYREMKLPEQSLNTTNLGLASNSKNCGLWLNKGNALLELRRTGEAKTAFYKVIQYAQTDSSIIAKAFTSIGIAYKYEKKYPKAMEYIRKGILYKKSTTSIAASYNNLADIFLLQNLPDSAFHYYQKAITTILLDFKNNDWKANPDTSFFKNTLLKPDLMGYLRDKANAIKDTDAQRAIETYQLADHACDLIRHNSSEMQSKFFWREEAYPLYWQAVKLCYKLGKTDMAYYFFEKSRAIMLLEELNKRTADLQDKTQKAALTTLPTLQQNLNTNQAFIEYLTPDNTDEKMRDSVFALIVHKNKIELKRLYCPITELDDFIRNKQGKPDDSYAVFYHLWYQRLFDPLGIDNSIKSLAISGNGLLNSVSFESLLKTPEFRKENFLLYDYAVSYAYSATLKYESFTVQHPTKNLLGVAPIDFGRFNLPKLETTQAQLEKVLAIEPGEQLQSSAATKRAFLSLAPKYRYLQIFTHATEYDSIYSYEPAIYFADSVLSLSELYKQHFNADLAVLTACQTNRGQERLGEGSNSLARGFAFAGVPATIASLWYIPEKSASELTVAFYENINKGQSKDEALQNAKLSSINGSDRLNPYFWAGMVLIGNTDSAPNSSFNWWYVIGLGMFAVGIYQVFAKKTKRR